MFHSTICTIFLCYLDDQYRNPNDNTEVIELGNKCMLGVEDGHRSILILSQLFSEGAKGIGKGGTNLMLDPHSEVRQARSYLSRLCFRHCELSVDRLISATLPTCKMFISDLTMLPWPCCSLYGVFYTAAVIVIVIAVVWCR